MRTQHLNGQSSGILLMCNNTRSARCGLGILSAFVDNALNALYKAQDDKIVRGWDDKATRN